MIVVAIIAILASIAIPNFLTYRKTAHAKACMAKMNMIRGACVAYLVRTGKVETDPQKLFDNSSGSSFIKGVPECPIGGTYSISYDNQKQDFEISCSKADSEDHNVTEEEQK